jgi:hypothetical protein
LEKSIATGTHNSESHDHLERRLAAPSVKREAEGRSGQTEMALKGVRPALILKRASVSRSFGKWNDDDFDVLAERAVAGRIFKANAAPVGTPLMWTLAFGHAPRGSHAHARLCRDPRGRQWRHSPRAGGTFLVEFRTAAWARRWRSRCREARRRYSSTSRNVMPYGLFVPDVP